MVFPTGAHFHGFWVPRAAWGTAMKMATGPVESKGLRSDEAIFMRSGEPKDHEIFAQDDRG
jgi:hypothetical protein